MLVPVLLLCLSCAKKQEDEKTQLVLTVQDGTADRKSDATEIQAKEELPAEDKVNGFRFETTDEMVYCIGEGVIVRREPGLDGEATGVLNRGAYVQRIGKNGKWSRILINGTSVYVSADFLSAYPPREKSEEAETSP